MECLCSPKDSVAMSNPKVSSDFAAQSDPDSTNAPSDPDRAAESSVAEELEHLDLGGSHPVEAPEEAETRSADDEDAGSEGGGDVEEEEEAVRGKEEEELPTENGNRDAIDKEGDDTKESSRGLARKSIKYPVRPEAEDCSYYMKTGTCKFGANCKFNHPVRQKIQEAWEKQKPGQTECKYYLSQGGCKFGKACKFSHTQTNLVELNFLGLPMRPGEKECPYYMRTGTCKYAANCKFNHPDPTSGGDNPPVEYCGGVTSPLPSPAQLHSWSSQGSLHERPPFVRMVNSSTHVVSSPNSDWNGYQFPVNPAAGHSMPPPSHPPPPPPPPPPYLMHPTTENHIYTNHQGPGVVDEYPERPGQPECSYFIRNGDCKFKSNCKYHHPKERISKSPNVAFGDNGLPLRPDQNICTHYSRYGICKFGPACKFDHSVHVVPLSRQSSSDDSPLGTDGASMVLGASDSAAAEEQEQQQPPL